MCERQLLHEESPIFLSYVLLTLPLPSYYARYLLPPDSSTLTCTLPHNLQKVVWPFSIIMFYNFSQLSLLSAFLTFFSLTASHFVTTNGVQFELAGKPFTFTGGNLWQCGCSHELKMTASLMA